MAYREGEGGRKGEVHPHAPGNPGSATELAGYHWSKRATSGYIRIQRNTAFTSPITSIMKSHKISEHGELKIHEFKVAVVDACIELYRRAIESGSWQSSRMTCSPVQSEPRWWCVAEPLQSVDDWNATRSRSYVVKPTAGGCQGQAIRRWGNVGPTGRQAHRTPSGVDDLLVLAASRRHLTSPMMNGMRPYTSSGLIH